MADGRDPSAHRKSERARLADTFQGVAREWLELQRKKLALTTFAKIKVWFEQHLFPYIGRRPIHSLLAPDLLAPLRLDGLDY